MLLLNSKLLNSVMELSHSSSPGKTESQGSKTGQSIRLMALPAYGLELLIWEEVLSCLSIKDGPSVFSDENI